MGSGSSSTESARLHRHVSTVAQNGQTKTLALEKALLRLLWHLMTTVAFTTCLERDRYTVPYRSALRYNRMVHDVSHGPKSKHLSIHA